MLWMSVVYVEEMGRHATDVHIPLPATTTRRLHMMMAAVLPMIVLVSVAEPLLWTNVASAEVMICHAPDAHTVLRATLMLMRPSMTAAVSLLPVRDARTQLRAT